MAFVPVPTCFPNVERNDGSGTVAILSTSAALEREVQAISKQASLAPHSPAKSFITLIIQLTVDKLIKAAC